MLKNQLLKNKIETIKEINKQSELFEIIKKEYSTIDKKNLNIQNLRLEINNLQKDIQNVNEIENLQKQFNLKLKDFEKLKLDENKIINEIEI